MDRATNPMTALILAAGRGERMQHLTQDRPKPLLPLNGKTLIEHRIQALKQSGIKDIIINLHYKGQQIQDHLQDGQHLGVNITYSPEQDQLDVGGGIIQACRLASNQPLVITNADIDTDFDYSQLTLNDATAHLVLTDNPDHNPDGDFHLQDSFVSSQGSPKLTFTGISIINPNYFGSLPCSPLSYGQLIRPLIDQHAVTGQYYQGYWCNIDTPERLAKAQQKHQQTN